MVDAGNIVTAPEMFPSSGAVTGRWQRKREERES